MPLRILFFANTWPVTATSLQLCQVWAHIQDKRQSISPVFYAYMQDIEFVIGSMHDYPKVDPDKLGLIGFSMGGSAATLVQMRNTDIDAVIYLDTGIVFSIVDTWFKPSNYYDLNNLRAAQLYLSRNDAEGINVNFLDEIHYAESYSVMFDKDHKHPDFMSEGMFAGVIPNYLAQKHLKDPQLLFETVCTTIASLSGWICKKGFDEAAISRKQA